MEIIRLGRLAVTRDGAILPGAPPDVPTLRFAWRGRGCEAGIAAGRIRIAAEAARIPSTAGAGADRARAFAALAHLPKALPPGWRARLMPDHRIRIEADIPLPAPAMPAGVIAALVRFVLELDPFLDRLEAGGATPAPLRPAA